MDNINYNKFSIYNKDEKIADVELNPNNKLGTVKVKQYIEGVYRQWNKPDDEITNYDFQSWLEWRTLPPERVNIREVLEDIGILNYSRLAIIAKTHAVMGHDDIWIKFEGEELTFKDVSYYYL